jgi:hypothetical protein
MYKLYKKCGNNAKKSALTNASRREKMTGKYVQHPDGGFYYVGWSDTQGAFIAQRVSRDNAKGNLVDFENLTQDEATAVAAAVERARSAAVREIARVEA